MGKSKVRALEKRVAEAEEQLGPDSNRVKSLREQLRSEQCSPPDRFYRLGTAGDFWLYREWLREKYGDIPEVMENRRNRFYNPEAIDEWVLKHYRRYYDEQRRRRGLPPFYRPEDY